MRYVLALPRDNRRGDIARLIPVLRGLDDGTEFTVGTYSGWAQWVLPTIYTLYPLATRRALVSVDPRWEPRGDGVEVVTFDKVPVPAHARAKDNHRIRANWTLEHQALIEYADVVVAVTRERVFRQGAKADRATWWLAQYAESMGSPVSYYPVGPEHKIVAKRERLARRRANQTPPVPGRKPGRPKKVSSPEGPTPPEHASEPASPDGSTS